MKLYSKVINSFVVIGVVLSVCIPYTTNAYVSVHGYTRKDGTYVQPYVRSNPNGLKYDNYSYKPGQDLYNKSYGTGSDTWNTPTYITDPNYYIGKNIYDSNNSASPNYNFFTPPVVPIVPTIPTCPSNSSYDSVGSTCKCNYGYVVSGEVCVYGNSFCTGKYGYGSEYDGLDKQCKCSSGYQFDGSQCVYKSLKVCPLNASLNGDSCRCNAGYINNDTNDGCVLKAVCGDGYVSKNNICITYTQDCQNTFGINVYGVKLNDSTSNCFCNSGYQWNQSKTACEQAVIPLTNKVTPVNIINNLLVKQDKFIFTQDLKMGSRGNDVTELQKFLKNKGYYKISVTNYFGAFTKSGLIKFQSDNNLKADGILGQETRGYLNSL